MALLSPVYAVIVPFLFFVTVPLAVFAGITTTLAFSVLILRVLAAYLDIALSIVPQYLSGSSRKTRHRHIDNVDATGRSSTPSPPLRRWSRRRRRSSTAVSAGTITPVSDGGLGLAPSIGPERDFEGLGGWRVGSNDDDFHWTTINSRLELPDRQYGRNHHRSPSGLTTPGEGSYLMMKGRTRSVEPSRTSPNSSRTRTSSGPHVGFSKAPSDGYFPTMTTSPKAAKKVVI